MVGSIPEVVRIGKPPIRPRRQPGRKNETDLVPSYIVQVTLDGRLDINLTNASQQEVDSQLMQLLKRLFPERRHRLETFTSKEAFQKRLVELAGSTSILKRIEITLVAPNFRWPTRV